MIDLKKFRKDKNISKKELQDLLDLSQSYISSLENKIKPITQDIFDKLLECYGDELLQFKISDRDISNISESKSFYQKQKESKRLIPYYDIDFMAGTTEVFSNDHEAPSYLIDINPFNDCDFALPIFGDSMYPHYQNGDIVLCRRIIDKSIIPLGEAYLIVTSEHRMLKYLRKGTTQSMLLAVSENSALFDPFPIEIDKILKLYLVKGIIKRKAI